MSKRKKKNSPPVRLKRKRAVLDSLLAFDLTFPCADSSEARQEVDIYSCSGALKADTMEQLHFRIQFRPPLTKQKANSASIRVTHLPSKQSNCRLVVLPSTDQKENQTLGQGDSVMRFIVFETHAIQLNQKGGIFCMWLTLENNQLKAETKAHPEPYPPLLEPTVDPSFFMQARFGERYQGLPFFPPSDEFDESVLATLSIEASKIPQRLPIWFKVRGKVTGSKLTDFLGFYAPNIEQPPEKPVDGADEEANYKYQKDLKAWQTSVEAYDINQTKEFKGWDAVNVRRGRLCENKMILCYLNHYTDRSFAECGYFAHPLDPVNWGASPDGLIHDPHAKAPPHLARDFDLKDYDLTRGVVEFKATRFACKFSAYFVAQAIWEMQSANVLWCDIVRYSTGKWELDQSTGKYQLKGEACKVYRLFRRKQADELLVDCVRQALEMRATNNNTNYLHLLQTKPFVKFREYCDLVTRKCNEKADNLPIPTRHMIDYGNFYKEKCTNNDLVEEHLPPVNETLERIEERQYQLFNLYGDPEKARAFIQGATEQIADWSRLIKDYSNKE